eukprot:7748584-Alexandrium_andersonii.AAC.1
MAALRDALLPLEGAPEARAAVTVVTADDVRAATLVSLPRPALPAAIAALTAASGPGHPADRLGRRPLRGRRGP